MSNKIDEKIIQHYQSLKRTAADMNTQIEKDIQNFGFENTGHLRGMRDGLLLAVSSLERNFPELGE